MADINEAMDIAAVILSTIVAYNEGEYLIKKNKTSISVEKDSLDNFLNRSEVVKDGFSLLLENGTFSNVSDDNIEIQVHVLNMFDLFSQISIFIGLQSL